MMTLKQLAIAAIMTLALPLTAQDFGYPNDKAFFKAHWQEVVNDLGPDKYLDNAQYVLFDFDQDGQAELYLWFTRHDEYLYAKRGDKAVRVSESARTEQDQYQLDGRFYPHFMAPYQLLIDQPIKEGILTEQHIYDRFDVPGIWFRLHPKVEGKFGIKKAIEALNCFDCEMISDAMYALTTGQYDKEFTRECLVDLANGYAVYEMNTHYKNEVEFCYWNLADGDKLLAMHYHIGGYEDDDADWFEHTLFMRYNAKTQYLEPVVAPIQGFDFVREYNFALPRKGKNILLIGADDNELVWTGNGFKYNE